jgi:hypothetical protein
MPDPERLGAVVASFANTIGGWILIGVDDDGGVRGLQRDGRLDLQSHIAQLLRNTIDPVPPFGTAVLEIDGLAIAVLRVFQSDDATVILKRNGAVYLRDAGGKYPVSDRAILLDLAVRAAEKRERATARLKGQALVVRALNPPDGGGLMNALAARPAHTLRIVVRVAPLTVLPRFRGWAVSRAAAQLCTGEAARLALAGRAGATVRSGPVDLRGVASSRAPRCRRGSWCSPTRRRWSSTGRGSRASRRRGRGVGWGTRRSGSTVSSPGRSCPRSPSAEALRPGCVRPVAALAAGAGRAWRARGAVSLTSATGEVTIPAVAEEISVLTAAWRRELEREGRHRVVRGRPRASVRPALG